MATILAFLGKYFSAMKLATVLSWLRSLNVMAGILLQYALLASDSSLLHTNALGGIHDGSAGGISPAQMGALDWGSSYWLQPGSLLAIEGIWENNQLIGGFSLYIFPAPSVLHMGINRIVPTKHQHCHHQCGCALHIDILSNIDLVI